MIDLSDNTKIYYSIKEVAKHFNVNESLLRFWEKEFDIIAPYKSLKGTRRYTKEDIRSISLIYHLLKEEGLTIEGAKQKLKNKKQHYQTKTEVIARLLSIRKQLTNLLNEL